MRSNGCGVRSIRPDWPIPERSCRPRGCVGRSPAPIGGTRWRKPGRRSASDMAAGAPTRAAPASPEEAADALRDAAAGGGAVRFAGGGTKRTWGAPATGDAVEVSTLGLGRVLEHNAGDMTAVLEAGLPLARAQETFAGAGQML